MMIQEVAHHKKKVKKQTYVSWLDISNHHEAKFSIIKKQA